MAATAAPSSPPPKQPSVEGGARQQPEDDDDLICDFQLFDEHSKQAERFRKTLYYGELPRYSDRPSLALTSLAIEFFKRSLPPRDELRFLDMEYASRVMRNACVTPASVVVALMYAERLRSKNPQYMAQTNSCDLFLVSMMVASKFLYDDGADDEVYNDEWAKAADLELSDLNREEIQFLDAIQWNLLVRPKEFGTVLADIERRIALREVAKRQRDCPTSTSSSTYTDLNVLTGEPRLLSGIYVALYDYVLKVVTVSLVGYCACLLTVVASVAAVHFAIPLATKPRVVEPSSGCSSNSSSPTGIDSSLPYGSVLLEHQSELDAVLRRGPLDLGDDLENLTLCCLRSPTSCMGIASTEGLAPPLVEESTTLGIGLPWELLKRIKMSTQLGVLPNEVFPFSRDPTLSSLLLLA